MDGVSCARCASPRRIRGIAMMLAASTAAACSPGRDPQHDAPVAVVVEAAPRPVATPAVTGASAATAEAPSAVTPRKAFVDPPLPPELRDDGGLTPLPPRPSPIAMRPTIEGAPDSTAGEERP